jgi:protein-tyrosine kinase
MSRIHEALKKAQEERAAQQAASNGAPLASPSFIQSPEHTIAPTAVMEPPEAAAPAILESAHDAVTFETLLARCVQRRWNPDPSALLFVQGDDDSAGKETFRTLRTRLYQARATQQLRTILVTSALPGEGKTFITSNLAESIVRQPERRALLIDADLRISNLHTPLGAEPGPGLTDYLLGEADEFRVLQRGREDNLFLIAGGRSVPNPTELLANGRFERLLERLSPLFDWVLIDSPPTIPVSDSSIVGKFCDGVLMVVRVGATPHTLAQKACEVFQDRPFLGAVLNRADSCSEYGNYYKQGYSTEGQKTITA